MLFSYDKMKYLLSVTLFCITITGGLALQSSVILAKGTYSVKASTKPCNVSYMKKASYNANTKQYYMLRSYLEKLEKKGGGILKLKKGTYKIPCTLYIPSNVSINLKNGVVIKKTVKTDNKKLAADNTLFAIVPPSKSYKKNGVKKYAGSRNVTIQGSGTAIINLNNNIGGTSIAIGHAKKINISGITFKNMSTGSFINIAASKNVSINNCVFKGFGSASDANQRYAIRMETPDAVTKAFPYEWSKNDNTANSGINITNNKFIKLCSALGSEKYTQNIYHTGITIKNNVFNKLSNHAIRILNWSEASITGNRFTNIVNGTGTFCGIYASGARNPVITGNLFDHIAIPMRFLPANNKGTGKNYTTTYNKFSKSFSDSVARNTVTNAKLYYVPCQTTTATANATRLAYYLDTTTKNYVISAGSNPYHDYYTDDQYYNKYTKDYYLFRSYFEQIERVGGGTLTVKEGVYSITNTLYVPSNVTVNFQDGVKIKKGTNTGFSSTILVPSLSLFQFAPPSLSTTKGTISEYKGSHDVKFIGQGTVTIDLLFYNCCMAFVLGHNKNVLIQGINFHNYKGHHFIELNSSKNITIQNCVFQGSSFNGVNDDYKEAINIDTPDDNTGGFNVNWSIQDRTPNDNILITNNTFLDVLRAIGTHKYSVSPRDNTTQMYHNNVQIINNKITNTNSYAIRAINWKDCLIKDNTIKNIGNGNSTAILMSGVVNPTVTENVFDTALRPITLNSKSNEDSPLPDKKYPPTHTILDSNKKNGVNLTAMLNNTLIDMTGSNQIVFYIGGSNKENSTEVKKYKFDDAHIHYTYPTATPAPTN